MADWPYERDVDEAHEREHRALVWSGADKPSFPRAQHPLCPKTGKLCYPSAKAARRVMRHLSARLRAYRCPHCGSVHLTKAGEQGRGGRKKRRPRG